MYDFASIKKIEEEKYGLRFPCAIERIRQEFFSDNKYEIEMDAFYYSLGGAVCGPIFTFFCEWAVQTAIEENIGQIFPIMRDGILYSKLLKIIVAKMKADIAITPIYVSRKSSYFALCYHEFDKEFFYEIATSHPKSIRVCFCKLGIEDHSDIYEVREQEIDRAIFKGEYACLEDIYGEILRRGLSDQINCRIHSTKELLRGYLKQNGAGQDFITVDVGSLGRIPQAIDNCTGSGIRKVHLFLSAESEVKERLSRGHDIRWFIAKFEPPELNNLFCSLFSYHLLETITMGNAGTGTATGYQQDGTNKISVCLGPKRYTAALCHAIDIIQDGICDFCIKYLDVKLRSKERWIPKHMISYGLKSYYRLVDTPFIEEVKNLGWFECEESEENKVMRFIAEFDYSSFNPRPLPEFELHLSYENTSLWTQGAKLIRTAGKEESINCRRVVVYGCGFFGKAVIERLELYDVSIVCIVDQKLAGEVYQSYPIISINELDHYDFDDVIIASMNFEDEIGGILKNYEIASGKKFKTHRIVID